MHQTAAPVCDDVQVSLLSRCLLTVMIDAHLKASMLADWSHVRPRSDSCKLQGVTQARPEPVYHQSCVGRDC